MVNGSYLFLPKIIFLFTFHFLIFSLYVLKFKFEFIFFNKGIFVKEKSSKKYIVSFRICYNYSVNLNLKNN